LTRDFDAGTVALDFGDGVVLRFNWVPEEPVAAVAEAEERVESDAADA
jgi:hypothetical protein